MMRDIFRDIAEERRDELKEMIQLYKKDALYEIGMERGDVNIGVLENIQAAWSYTAQFPDTVISLVFRSSREEINVDTWDEERGITIGRHISTKVLGEDIIDTIVDSEELGEELFKQLPI
jgi:hypothetical protein